MLEIRNLCKTYQKNGKKAVDDLSLTINSGELCGFIGLNGAGKTTTIRCIIGALNFEEGEIMIDKKSIKADPLSAKKIMAYIPDNPNLYEFLTGIQYVNYIADIYEISVDMRKEKIPYFADILGLTKNLGDLISSYSHGMKQKLALIAAFVHEPKLLILDEPFVGLDPIASAKLKQSMRVLCDDGGAIFFSTHILEVAEKICDKIAIIKGGRLVASGTVEEVTKNESLEEYFLDMSSREV